MRVLSVPRSQCMHITYGRQPNASTTYVPFYICTLFDYVGCVDGSSECLLYAHRGIRNIIFVYPHVVVLFAQLRESCPQACGVCRPPTTVALAHSFAFFPIDYRIRGPHCSMWLLACVHVGITTLIVRVIDLYAVECVSYHWMLLVVHNRF